MMDRAALATALGIACLALTPAWGHGASKGLHLHADPEKGSPGTEIVVSVDCAEPMTQARIGFAEGEVVEVKLETPARRLAVPLAVPSRSRPGATINVHAEVTTVAGTTRRAALLVEVIAPYRLEKSPVEKRTAIPVSEKSPTPSLPKTCAW
jgi:hypothetical protein